MRQKTILLFQPYLRKHILDFGKATSKFQFVVYSNRYAKTKDFYKKSMSTPREEFSRSKLGLQNRLRRLLGILNVRIKFIKNHDLLFTYGCLLITNKPYCVYVENGAALFNYDPFILRNFLAKCWFAFLIRLPQCKKLIFMSETALTSLIATGKFSQSTKRILQNKSVQIYPFVKDPKQVEPKKFSSSIKFLFTGIYYVKGGREAVNAFEKISKVYPDTSLTIVTPLHMLLPEDKEHILSLPKITLLDAAFSAEEMENLYRTHDVFIFPTFRDTFGLVLIEALSFGMPLIATDQYATTEMALENYNAFVFKNHPLLDYDPDTKEMYGKLYNAKTFYETLFSLEEKGAMAPVEEFLFDSLQQFLTDPSLLEKYSKNSLELYQKKFRESLISQKIETAFTEATS